jgi:predicted secreted protein
VGRHSAVPAFLGAGGLLAFALQASPALAAPCLSGTYQSLTVTNGQTIDLCGHVTGGVIIQSGGALVTENGATIGGGITAQPGAVSLRLQGTRVGGGVSATSVVGDKSSPPTAVSICGSTIAGSVTVSNAGGLVRIGGTGGGCAGDAISGGVIVKNDTHGLDIVDDVVGGAVDVNGDAYSSESLTIGCYVFPSECTDAAQVGGNTISGALVCSGNPFGVFRDPSVAPNVVYGATLGQCRSEGTVK